MTARQLYTTITVQVLMLSTAWAQGPHNTGTYYQAADGQRGEALKTAMFQIVNQLTQSYIQYVSDAFGCYATEMGVLPELYEEMALKGDVNGDGEITIADVTALVNILLGKDASGYDHDAADVNSDGGRTIADVTALVNILLGKKA